MGYSENSHNLIPGLPDEIGRECLLRVPYNFHSILKSVCHSWRNYISNPSYYQQRRISGTADHLVFLVQPLPSPPPPSDSSDGHDTLLHHPTETAIITSTKKEGEDDHHHRQQQQQHQRIRCPPQYGLSIYNATGHTWHRASPDCGGGIPIFCQCVAIPSSGKILLLGGWDPTTLEPVADVYVLDLINGGGWRRGPPMNVARSFFACAVVGPSSVYVAGGHDNQKNALRSAEVYDVEAEEWKMLGEMEEERDECLGLSWEGDSRFWVVSGYGSESQGQFRSDAECYEPATGQWSRVEGVWPYSSMGPRGITTTVTAAVSRKNKQKQYEKQWWWFLGAANEEEDGDEGRWKVVRSVEVPESIRGTLPCVTSLGLSDDRIMVMSGGGGRGEGRFILEWDSKSGNAKWNKIQTPAGFYGFPYSASYLLI